MITTMDDGDECSGTAPRGAAPLDQATSGADRAHIRAPRPRQSAQMTSRGGRGGSFGAPAPKPPPSSPAQEMRAFLLGLMPKNVPITLRLDLSAGIPNEKADYHTFCCAWQPGQIPGRLKVQIPLALQSAIDQTVGSRYALPSASPILLLLLPSSSSTSSSLLHC